MIRQHRVFLARSLPLALLFGVCLVWSGCTAPEACGEVGVVELCACGATDGARVCMAERTWGACDCTGAIPLPNQVGEVDAGGGTGGVAGSSGTGGTGGTGGVQPTPYDTCTGPSDCAAPNKCFSSMSGADTLSFCSQECLVASDCPRPTGAYDAVVRCLVGYCGLDCTPALFQPLLSCPAGMICVAPPFGGSAVCHDDGM